VALAAGSGTSLRAARSCQGPPAPPAHCGSTARPPARACPSPAPNRLPQLLPKLVSIAAERQPSEAARGLIVSALAKLAAQSGAALPAEARELLHRGEASRSTELQQRASEVSALTAPGSQLLAKVGARAAAGTAAPSVLWPAPFAAHCKPPRPWLPTAAAKPPGRQAT
jgi:hypothetical protein